MTLANMFRYLRRSAAVADGVPSVAVRDPRRSDAAARTVDHAVELTVQTRAKWEDFRSLPVTHIPVATQSRNLGDDVQSEAAARFWDVRQYVDRDQLVDWPSGAVVPMIGWYSDGPLVPASAQCIVVGFHLEAESRAAFTETKFKDWFASQVRQQGFPAQCRDIATRDFLRSQHIDAEFSGCVTYTLNRFDGARDGGVLSVDAKVPWRRYLIRRVPQEYPDLHRLTPELRLQAASERIDCLARAKHVHTTRLHTLLPCRALNTPVTFYASQVCFQPGRFSGHLA